MSIELSRRDFIGTCSAAACSVSLGMAEASVLHPGGGYTGTLCLFSKPLPGMGWRRLAQAAKSVESVLPKICPKQWKRYAKKG